MKAKYVFLFLVYLLCKGNVQAQSGHEALNRKRLNFSFYGQGSRQLQGNDSFRFDCNQFNVSFLSPVFNNSANTLHAFVSPSIGMGKLNFGQTGFNRYTIMASLPLVFFYKPKGKNSYMLSASAFFSEDEYTLSDFYPRYLGLFIFNRKVSDKFSYHLGATSTYLLAERLTLPVIGARFRTGSKSSLNINLPFTLRYSHFINSRFSYSLSLKPSGMFTRFQNKRNLDTTNRIFYFRRSAYALGWQGNYILRTGMLLKAQAGVLFSQRIRFTEPEQNTLVQHFNYNTPATGYITISLVFTFIQDTKTQDSFSNITDDDLRDIGIPD